MRVSIVQHITTNECSCSSLLEHWMRYRNGTWGNNHSCAVVKCHHTQDIQGVRVRKVGVLDDITYVVPLCREHAMSQTELDIGVTSLAYANPRLTCNTTSKLAESQN